MVSWALVSIGEPAGGAGVGRSVGFGTAMARGELGVPSSVAADFVAVGLGVLSGSG